jgi:hypothetical protein
MMRTKLDGGDIVPTELLQAARTPDLASGRLLRRERERRLSGRRGLSGMLDAVGSCESMLLG